MNVQTYGKIVGSIASGQDDGDVSLEDFEAYKKASERKFARVRDIGMINARTTKLQGRLVKLEKITKSVPMIKNEALKAARQAAAVATAKLDNQVNGALSQMRGQIAGNRSADARLAANIAGVARTLRSEVSSIWGKIKSLQVTTEAKIEGLTISLKESTDVLEAVKDAVIDHGLIDAKNWRENLGRGVLFIRGRSFNVRELIAGYMLSKSCGAYAVPPGDTTFFERIVAPKDAREFRFLEYAGVAGAELVATDDDDHVIVAGPGGLEVLPPLPPGQSYGSDEYAGGLVYRKRRVVRALDMKAAAKLAATVGLQSVDKWWVQLMPLTMETVLSAVGLQSGFDAVLGGRDVDPGV